MHKQKIDSFPSNVKESILNLMTLLRLLLFKNPVDDHEPTNWKSKFGGSAWQFVPELNQYYLHVFDVRQSDLNWDNPQVRQEMADIVNFWRDK